MKIILGDITKLDVDCIVNAANETLLGGGGVDFAIHKAAGPELYNECKTLGGCKTGKAKITKGYNLPSKFVIHTVGPVYDGSRKNEKDLYSCYQSCLDLAKKNNIRKIAFPSISTGAYGYPIDKAVVIALKSIRDWKKSHNYEVDVVICCYNYMTYEAYQRETRGN